MTFPKSSYYIFPTHKLSVVIEKLRLSIANCVFHFFVCKFGKKIFELATRVDNYAIEDWAADLAAETTASAETPASVTAAATGYQLASCWWG